MTKQINLISLLKSVLFLGSILFFSLELTAQEKVISIEYMRGLLPVEQYKGKTNKELQNVQFEPRLLQDVTYELLITDQKSHFSLKELGLTNDGRVVNGRYRKKIIVYVNNSTQEIISQEVFFGNKQYIVTHPFNNIDWHLTDEHKTILGHPCRKAIGKRPIYVPDFNKKTITKGEQLLIAWYAKDLPFSFGPEKFNGLPGVILEIIYSRYSYKASEIEVNNKPVNKKIKALMKNYAPEQ